ncbi:hypothetical protein BsWGS_02512 [Bradybaena similaris]
MGAAASTQLATEFFEEKRRPRCPPTIHLDMNMDTKKVTEEGVKLMPGGALIVPSLECPLHQIGDGKGASGKLRTVDSCKYKSHEPNKLMSSSRFLSQKSKTQKGHEGKSLVKSVKEANEQPGHTPTEEKPEVEANPDLKPLFMIEQGPNHQEIFQTLVYSSPENNFSGNNMSAANESPVKQANQTELSPPPENHTITPVIAQASLPVLNQTNASFLKEASVPLEKETSNSPAVLPCEPPLNQEIKNATPVFKDIVMDNVIHPPDLRPGAGQPFLMMNNKDMVVPSIPASTDDAWSQSAKQTFYSSMLRKGWIFKETDMSSEYVKNMMKIHNANHELAWREVLKWEALHADECKDPKLKSCSSFGTKYSPRARIRSWLGYALPFDRHDWIIDRNGKEVRYIVDYYDGGKFNSNFEFALLDVRPALDSFEALWDRVSVFIWRWTSPDNSADSVNYTGITSVSEPLNIGSKPTDAPKGQNASQFMSYNLSDVEREREKKNSVS